MTNTKWHFLCAVLLVVNVGAVVHVNVDSIVAQVLPEFLSVTIDTSELVKSKFWNTTINVPYPFDNETLRLLAKELNPAYIRVGGTAADQTIYSVPGHDNLSSVGRDGEDAKLEVFTMTKEEFDSLNEFALDVGMSIFFGLNAGPSARPSGGITFKPWDPSNAIALLNYTAYMGYPIAGWELSNEPNLYLFNFGKYLEAKQLGEDFRTLRGILDAQYPQHNWTILGPDLAYQIPYVGDLWPNYLKDFVEEAQDSVDVITWHWYALQSKRCPAWWIDPLYATMDKFMKPSTFNLMNEWADQVERVASTQGTKAYSVFVGESAGISCGGSPGISNAYVASFWFLDELGNLARRGQKAVMRQDLTGASYGLIDWNGKSGDATVLSPNPTYWAGVLWKRLMGEYVLNVSSIPGGNLDSTRIYAHCAPSNSKYGYGPGSVSILLINLDHTTRVDLNVSFSGQTLGSIHDEFVVSPLGNDKVSSRVVGLNGKEIRFANGKMPSLSPKRVNGRTSITMEPLTYGFFVFPHAGASACAIS